MELAIVSAFIGSVCLGLMIIFDRLMMGDCYGNKSDHAWFISSSLGATFGLLATTITWIIYSLVTNTTLHEIFATSIELLWPHGALMLLVGAINIQVMRHYFRLFIPDKNERVNETAIAMWLAAVPIFIFLSIGLIQFLGLNHSILPGLNSVNLSPSFGIAIVLAAITMILFEYTSGGRESFRVDRVSEIVKMISCIVIYTILSSSLLRDAESDVVSTLALQPFYWLGFAAGIRSLFPQNALIEFKGSWPKIRVFAVPIVVVEIIGMGVYYFEFFALSGAEPALVNLITGAHIIPVFLLSLVLYQVRINMLKSNIEHLWFMGLSFTRDKLPDEQATLPRVVCFCAVVVTLLFAISQS